MTSLLSVDSIETYYGVSQALYGVSLQVNPGEVVALMGRNGMGKSTTIGSICGLNQPCAGSIYFEQTPLTEMPAFKVSRLGIALVPEGRRCFSNLTVRENLLVAARPGPWTLAKIAQLIPRLEERTQQSAATLSGGEQQMLAIGRGLMLNPKLLILDEATEGLAPVIREEIWAILKTLKSQGQSILVVDKSLQEMSCVVDHCVILEKGRNVWKGTPAELDADVSKRYLGV